MGGSRVRPVRSPPAVRSSASDEDVQGVVHPRVLLNPCLGEGIETAQHVEVPTRWMVQAGELGIDRLPAPLAALQPVPQEELD